ncbi:MAG TPA: tRNA lysidine(34) synthetase TilS [Gemmataceae bacterium]|nr:tRNA lysidine(34) synthetase TilS [Gemmataceae bacterium]
MTDEGDCISPSREFTVKVVSPLVRKVGRWLHRHGVSPEGMVVAVSGGPDSVALLRALVALRPNDARVPLVVAHLNHRLRGEESDGDEAFVRRLCDSLLSIGTGLELRCERIDMAARAAAAGANLEATARQVRYEWLAQVAHATGSRWVATGHTADDQAETVLHRLLRGTGLRGLRGIAARRGLAPGVELVRPLLQVSRAEVLAYLESEGQAYRQDSSNLDRRHTRNRIRHELLPLLARDYNPAIVTVLGRLAEQADEIYREQEARARALLAEAELPRAGRLLVFDRRRLADAPRHLVREVFRLVWEREGWPTGAMTFAHWDRAAAVAQGEMPAVELPDGLHVWCRERVVQVGPGS